MNQIEIFNSPEFGSIRTLEQNGKVLFCGTDVATALGYTNPRKAVRDHTRGGTKCSIGVQTGKKADGSPAVQMVEMLFIPEGDLYRLIAHSKLPSAERFEQWVFDEVLPAIRKHGAYLTKEKLWEIATSPEALIKLCSELLAEREENASLREENALLESKAAFYDLFIDLNHSTNLRTTAKELLVPERRFVRFLLEKRFVYRTASGNVLPYAKPANEGLFCVKDYCNHGHIGSYTLITPQGKKNFIEEAKAMQKQRVKTSMSVPEMGKMLGLGKVESYWLVKKNYFKTIQVAGRMRVMLDSFEDWYAGQFHYKKVDGTPPGEKWRHTTMSVPEMADLLGLKSGTAYDLVKRGYFETTLIDRRIRIITSSFEAWYQKQTHYVKISERLTIKSQAPKQNFREEF